ncbi:MAG TPA: GAF domain-containing protein [Gemmatimonadaceae bacterium]
MQIERESQSATEGRGVEAGRRNTRTGGVGRVVAVIEARLREGGVPAALEMLNARTRFRFTGIYRAEPPLLRNVFLVDRENPTVRVCGAVCPLDETYCAITCAREAAFMTHDATRDARLGDHPARDSVISYAGVPLRLAGGRAWGTLCHFDLRPRLLPRGELVLLEAAAPIFVRWLLADSPTPRLPSPRP